MRGAKPRMCIVYLAFVPGIYFSRLPAFAQPCHTADSEAYPGFSFSAGFSDDMVLQRAPAKAALYGFGSGKITITVTGLAEDRTNVGTYTVQAQAGPGGTWKAFLKPHPAGGEYTVEARQDSNTHALRLSRVTFGDVFLCSGQSNMALETYYTFSADTIKEDVLQRGRYQKLRLFEYGKMRYNCSLASWTPTWATAQNSAVEDPKFKWYNMSSGASSPYEQRAEGMFSALQHFSATCLYFGIELLDALGPQAPPIGLIETAVGGSTIEAWMANETIDQCTDEFNFTYGNPKKGETIRGGISTDQHIPGTLHYGYLCPFANMSLSGFLWYQGENNCGAPTTGNSKDGTGYGCSLPAMISAWRQLFSVVPGTTPALAPFGIATLAAGGSEGAGPSAMSGMRWSQQANYGQWDNPAMPNTFGAQLYDMGDPWGHSGTGDGDKRNGHRLNQTQVNSPWIAGNQTKCCKDWSSCAPARCSAAQNKSIAHCNALQQHKGCVDSHDCALPDPTTGHHGTNCTWNSSLWWGTLKSMEPLVRANSPSGIPGNNFMGGIHPRFKRPAGRRLAIAAVNLIPEYRALSPTASVQTAKTGPTISGCDSNNGQLILHFNKSLLGNESLTLRPWDSNQLNWAYKPNSNPNNPPSRKSDSAGLMICTIPKQDPENPNAVQGNATTCQCAQWASLNVESPQGEASNIRYCAIGPGWKPSAAVLAQGKPGRDQNNPFGAQWVAASFKSVVDDSLTKSSPDVVSLEVDLSNLEGKTPLAVRLGWPLFRGDFSADDMCCVHAASQKGSGGGLAPCVPGNCPLYSSKSELPANPFFATISSSGKCACPAPQNCDY